MKTTNNPIILDARISGHGDYVALDSINETGIIERSVLYKSFNPESENFDQEYYNEFVRIVKLIAAAPRMLNRLKQLKSDMNQLLETVLKGGEVSDTFVQNKINEINKEIQNATE